MTDLKLRAITDVKPVSETRNSGKSMKEENEDENEEENEDENREENKEELKIAEINVKNDLNVREEPLTVVQEKTSAIRSQEIGTASLANAVIPHKPNKDIWDKLMAVSPIISGMLIFVAGGVFTYTYNQQQLKVQEIQTIEKFIPHLTGSEQSKKAAILAINSLTDAKLAGKIASLYASQGTVSALQSMTTSGNYNERAIAQQALTKTLDTLKERESRLDDMESAYRKALANDDQPEQFKSTDSDTPANLIGMAAQYKNLGLNALAEQLLKRALVLTEKRSGAESQEAAEIWRRLAEVYATQGNRSQSEISLKRAKAIDAKLSPQPKPQAREELQDSPAPANEPGQESSDADSEPNPKKVEKATDTRRVQRYNESAVGRYMHLPDFERNLNL